jgi:proline dehydrogenase
LRALDRNAGEVRMAGTQLQDAEAPWTTAPPPGAPHPLRSVVRRAASACLLPLLQRGARAWIGGASLEDGLAVARRLADEGRPSTIGLWDTPEYSARQVAGEVLAGIDALATDRLDAYLSIKPPALRFDGALAVELASAARARGVSLHVDSHAPEGADASNALVDAMRSAVPGRQLGTTLPGRWARSASDAGWAVDRELAVRVVKGQWPDPADPDRDPRAGFLEIVDRLAGRARQVRVATHDVPLAAEAIRRLRRAGTPCELELLHGVATARSLRWADASDVPVRIYVPYGKGYTPHAIAQLRRDPRLLWWALRELLPARRHPALEAP